MTTSSTLEMKASLSREKNLSREAYLFRFLQPVPTHLSLASKPHIYGIIPARWASSRFPGKPLHLIAGKPLVQHVYDRVSQCKSLTQVIIATDDERIERVCKNFGATVCMTDPSHESGTDRIAEVATQFPDADALMNLQGDEPLIDPELVDELANALIEDPRLEMITAGSPLEDLSLQNDPNVVKLVLNRRMEALYFSRSPLPHQRNSPPDIQVYRHLGIYGYQRQFLERFISLPPSMLERTESLEQLRALEDGARIKVILTNHQAPGVDTPEQADLIESLLTS